MKTDAGDKLKIIHKHYSKPMANKYVIYRNAAMSIKNKRTILTQMCLKILLNNSIFLATEERKGTIENFMKRMQASGYDERFRLEVLKSAIQAYSSIQNNPLRTMYRGKETNTPEGRMERKKRKRTWFRKGGSESVMFIPATPGSVLAQRIREEVEMSNLKIRVVEKPGTKIKRLLQKNDTTKLNECGEQRCFVCSTSQEGKCRKTGVVYVIKCKGDCNGDLYYGETNTSAYTRGLEHLNDYEHKRAHSVMWKHCLKKHQGEEQPFEMKVSDCIRNDPTRRQIMEAVRINGVEEVKRMNDRREWIVGKIPTMTVGEI